MSYCRWSSMNWMCDVYVYESVEGGWTTHVAKVRRLFPPIPDLPLLRLPSFGGTWDKEARKMVYPRRLNALCARIVFRLASFWHSKVHLLSLELIPLHPIGLPNDGERFISDTAAECADLLEQLRATGYIVPDYAIAALRQEHQEREA